MNVSQLTNYQYSTLRKLVDTAPICDKPGCIDMPPGEVQIDGRVIQRSMAEQHLDGAQVRPCFKQVSRVAVPQAMRGDVLFDPGSSRGVLAREPDHLVANRHIGSPAIDDTRKQESLRLHPSPVAAPLFKKRWAERYIAVAPSLALTYVDHHQRAVDVRGLQLT